MRVAFCFMGACLAAALCGGCESEPHHSAASRDSDRAISSAEGAGAESASDPLLRKATDFRDRAATLDNDAINDRNAAAADKNAAEKRAHHAELVKDQVGRQLEEARKARDDDAREVESSSGSAHTVAQTRLEARDAEIAALEQEVKCGESETKDADLTIQSSDARMATAEEHRKLAQDLRSSAEHYARAAEAKRLDVKSGELREKTDSTGTPTSPSGP